MRKELLGIILFLVSVGFICSQTIKVTQPNEGSVFQQGQEMRITWTSSGITGNVGIALVKTDQAERHVINLKVPCRNHFISYKIPASIAPGNYYIAIGNPETASASACFEIRKPAFQGLRTTLKAKAVPPKPKPDLIIESIEISDRTSPYDKILNRDELHFIVTVKNIGTQACLDDFYLGLSTWGCNTDTWKWQEIYIGTLDSGAKVQTIIRVRGNSHISGWDDNANVCIKVDVRNQVAESSENNNTRGVHINVEGN